MVNELDSSNYATKADLKIAAGVDISDFAKKFCLASLKSEVDKLDINKLKNVPINLSNLKTKVDKLHIGKLEATPVDLIKLCNVVKNDVVKKNEYDELIKKADAIQTTDTSNLAHEADYDTKFNKVLKRFTDYGHAKYITPRKINKLMLEYFTPRFVQVHSAGKTDIANCERKKIRF